MEQSEAFQRQYRVQPKFKVRIFNQQEKEGHVQLEKKVSRCN